VYKNIFATFIWRDEPKTFCFIKPFYFACRHISLLVLPRPQHATSWLTEPRSKTEHHCEEKQVIEKEFQKLRGLIFLFGKIQVISTKTLRLQLGINTLVAKYIKKNTLYPC